jgi:hypothetical protein
MKTKFGSITLGILFGVLLLQLGSKPVAAQPPVVTFIEHREGSAQIVDCGTFQIIDDFIGDLTVTVFFDNDGESRLDIDFQGIDSIRNSSGEPSYTSPFHNKILVDLDAALGNVVGVNFAVTVPGYGTVFMDVGRLVVDEAQNLHFRAGPHQAVDADYARLCEAFK